MLASKPAINVSYHANGMLNERTALDGHGDFHGLYEKYDMIGRLVSQENFSHGTREGRALYFVDSEVVLQVTYADGTPVHVR